MNPADLLKNLSPAARARNAHQLESQPVGIPQVIKRRKGRPEGELQDEIVAYAESRGWLVYHTHNSQRSRPGFPDLVFARGHRLVVAELKSETGTVSEAQSEWLQAFLAAGCQTYVWRPDSWPEIERVLT